MKERIICSAIWYKEQTTAKCLPTNIDIGVVIAGHRHTHCIHTFVALTGKRSVLPECGDYVQGFLTDLNRFVDRIDAWKIADEAGQILDYERTSKNYLYSEDIY